MPPPEIVEWMEHSVLLDFSFCSFDCSSGSQEPEILLSLQLDTGHLSLPWMDGWMDGMEYTAGTDVATTLMNRGMMDG